MRKAQEVYRQGFSLGAGAQRAGCRPLVTVVLVPAALPRSPPQSRCAGPPADPKLMPSLLRTCLRPQQAARPPHPRPTAGCRADTPQPCHLKRRPLRAATSAQSLRGPGGGPGAAVLPASLSLPVGRLARVPPVNFLPSLSAQPVPGSASRKPPLRRRLPPPLSVLLDLS